MVVKNLIAETFSWWVSYDYMSREAVPDYNGPLSIDFYGRVHPKHSNGETFRSAAIAKDERYEARKEMDTEIIEDLNEKLSSLLPDKRHFEEQNRPQNNRTLPW